MYSYASNPDRLLDDHFACALTVRTGLHPANADERNLFPDSFAQLRARFLTLKIGEILADAAQTPRDNSHPLLSRPPQEEEFRMPSIMVG